MELKHYGLRWSYFSTIWTECIEPCSSFYDNIHTVALKKRMQMGIKRGSLIIIESFLLGCGFDPTKKGKMVPPLVGENLSSSTNMYVPYFGNQFLSVSCLRRKHALTMHNVIMCPFASFFMSRACNNAIIVTLKRKTSTNKGLIFFVSQFCIFTRQNAIFWKESCAHVF